MNLTILLQYPWYTLINPIYLVICSYFLYLYQRYFIKSHYYTVTKLQINSFVIAVLFVFITRGSPLTVIAERYLFSALVFNMAVLLFIVVPLVIISLPTDFIRKYFWHHRLRYMMKLFSYPWLAALVFNGALTIYFVPSLFNIIQQSVVLNVICHVILIFTAILMWWTIMAPLPGINQFSYFTRVGYVFLNAFLLMPIGFFLLLTTEQTYYPTYEMFAHQLLPALTAVYDQQLGGGLLKSIQLISYGTALFFLINIWAKKEEDSNEENVRIVQGIVIQLPTKK